ncbi:Transcription initiation factor TFIIIB, Brf1 subunit [Ceraceosorus bombacis]|uniref:B-related factor 1 n=1 Tax=Ceraceosorus bombacis TaxID=401625 RepID=A0A0P1BDH7_9BASI|nr:Transcription initiation factor TFIIIB, Brf1 subunit [Ceraceosorus bombacis]
MLAACPQCGQETTALSGNTLSCEVCGTVLEESEIVNDVGFAENSFGGAVVQGSYVADDATGARSSLAGMRGMSGSGSNSTTMTLLSAQRGIRALASAKNVPSSVAEQASRLFKLALSGGTARENGPKLPNFVLGRRSEYTQAACLYLSCRLAKTNHLLIDFADALQVNVFILGRAYQRLVDCLNFRDKEGIKDAVDPSRFVMRFASMLDFGDLTNNVATDATRLVARFKHDWLVDGRRPAGICGACILLAARMNGFRRSITEVVQVVKIADSTIRERLKEFKNTPMANLPIHDFRTRWDESYSLPPSFKPPRSKGTKRAIKPIDGSKLAKRKKTSKGGNSGAQEAPEAAAKTDNEDVDAEDEAAGADNEEDEDALSDASEVPPDLDRMITKLTKDELMRYMDRVDYARLDKQVAEREQRRAARAKAGVPGNDESELEDIRAMRPSPAREMDYIQATTDAIKTSGSQMEGNVEKASPSHANSGAGDVTSPSQVGPPANLRASPHREVLEPDEVPFATTWSGAGYLPPSEKKSGSQEPHDDLTDLNDEELNVFILTPEESRAKERVWLEFNKDFLQRSLEKQLKLERDLKMGIQPKTPSRRKSAKPKDSSTAAASALESTQQMMHAKKQFSRKLNYANLSSLFETGDPAADDLNMHSTTQPWASTSRRGRRRGRRARQEGEQEGASGPAQNYYNSDAETSASEFEYETIELETNEAPSTAKGSRKESREMKRHKAKKAISAASSNASGTEDGDATPARAGAAGSGTDQGVSANEEDYDEEEADGDADLDEDAKRIRAMASSYQELEDDDDDDGEAY